jgi:hypothetical protein
MSGKVAPVASLAGAGIVGFLSYGVSLTCFVLALRDLGTARTGAYFSTAPFIGVLLSLLLLRVGAGVRGNVLACWRASILPSTAALRNKSGEAFHEGCKSPPCFLVDHFALAIERFVGV